MHLISLFLYNFGQFLLKKGLLVPPTVTSVTVPSKLKNVYRTMDLLSLPTNVLFKVLCAQVTLKDLVRLDSAYCQQHLRHIWMQFLRSKQCTFECEIDLSSWCQTVWLNQKSVKSSQVLFLAEIEIQKDVSTHLRANGSHIRVVTFQGGTKAHEMVLVALNCTYLTTLRAVEVEMTCAFTDILLRNPNLQKIDCTEVNCEETEIFAGVSLHKLNILKVDDANCLEGFPWHDTAYSESLHTVLWNCTDFHVSDMRALFRNCLNVRSFSNDDIGSRSVLAYNLTYLQHLVNLSTSNNDDLVDDDVLSIAKQLTQLRTLNLQHCAELTDICLQHLATHAGDRLEVLYVDVKYPESAQTEAILECFGQKCVQLQYLNINCTAAALCEGSGTSSLVCGCPQLHTLVVDRYSAICEPSRYLIAKFRPQLHLLVHNESTSYNILAMPLD